MLLLSPKHKSLGYSLLETMMVMAIAGVMALVGVNMMSNYANDAKLVRAEANMRSLMNAVMDHYTKQKIWPARHSDLPLIYGNVTQLKKNPWGNDYVFNPPPTSTSPIPFELATELPSPDLAFKLTNRLGNATRDGNTVKMYAGSMYPEIKENRLIIKEIKQLRHDRDVTALIEWKPELRNDPLGSNSDGLDYYPGVKGSRDNEFWEDKHYIATYKEGVDADRQWKEVRLYKYVKQAHPSLSTHYIDKPTCPAGMNPGLSLLFKGYQKGCMEKINFCWDLKRKDAAPWDTCDDGNCYMQYPDRDCYSGNVFSAKGYSPTCLAHDFTNLPGVGEVVVAGVVGYEKSMKANVETRTNDWKVSFTNESVHPYNTRTGRLGNFQGVAANDNYHGLGTAIIYCKRP